MSDAKDMPTPGSRWRRLDDGDIQRVVSIEKASGEEGWTVCAVGAIGAFLGPLEQFAREATRL